MDGLGRFDIAEHRGVCLVVIESDLLPPDPSIVVIPLLTDYPAVRHLNSEIAVGERRLIRATRLIAAVRRASLTRTGSAMAQGDDITRAVDILMGGV